MKILLSVFEMTRSQRGGKRSVILHCLPNISHQMLICFYVTSDTYEIGHFNSFGKELNFSLHMLKNSHYLFLSFLSNVVMNISQTSGELSLSLHRVLRRVTQSAYQLMHKLNFILKLF